MKVYYNDNDAFVCAWLRNLMADGLLPEGVVDERSILDVRPEDVREFDQAHFFAGIGGWAYALQLAGVPAFPCWTGSCPCQPLSSAGQRKGHADQRHLWPAFYRLIAECRPATIFGEQVASKDGREWFSAVRADLEALGYACGGTDLCAASIGAPHIRQRLWWLAYADSDGAMDKRRNRDCPDGEWHDASALQERAHELTWSFSASAEGVADTERRRLQGGYVERAAAPTIVLAALGRNSGRNSDGSPWRFEPDVGRVAYGVPRAMEQLRGFGNAIVPQVAAEFICASLEALADIQPCASTAAGGKAGTRKRG